MPEFSYSHFSKHSLRPYRRLNDSLVILLSMEEWPQDAPLPDGAAIAEIDGTPIE